MSLRVEHFPLDGLLLVTPQRRPDPRGFFVETYNQRDFAEAGIACPFVQDNQSLSRDAGTIRGLHFQTAHAAQAKLVRVLAGAIYDVAVDLRQDSPTFGAWCSATLTAAGGEQFFIPAGFAHGFCALQAETMVAYKVSAFYAPGCEGGLRWDDPDLAIAWPVAAAAVQVSEKDARLPFLRDLAGSLVF